MRHSAVLVTPNRQSLLTHRKSGKGADDVTSKGVLVSGSSTGDVNYGHLCVGDLPEIEETTIRL